MRFTPTALRLESRDLMTGDISLLPGGVLAIRGDVVANETAIVNRLTPETVEVYLAEDATVTVADFNAADVSKIDFTGNARVQNMLVNTTDFDTKAVGGPAFSNVFFNLGVGKSDFTSQSEYTTFYFGTGHADLHATGTTYVLAGSSDFTLDSGGPSYVWYV